jgi:hypothetical protein
MGKAPADLLLDRMFLARRVALGAAAVCVGTWIALFLGWYACLSTDHAQLRLIGAALMAPLTVANWAAQAVALLGSLVTWYYVFRVGLRGPGLGYALGHLLLCVVLTCVMLLGIMVVPLLLRYDTERWRRAEGELPDGRE